MKATRYLGEKPGVKVVERSEGTERADGKVKMGLQGAWVCRKGWNNLGMHPKELEESSDCPSRESAPPAISCWLGIFGDVYRSRLSVLEPSDLKPMTNFLWLSMGWRFRLGGDVSHHPALAASLPTSILPSFMWDSLLRTYRTSGNLQEVPAS